MLSLNATAASSTHIKASGADDLIRQPRRVFFDYSSAKFIVKGLIQTSF